MPNHTRKEVKVILSLYRQLGSWARVEDELGVNRGLLWRVAKGRQSVTPAIVAAVWAYERHLAAGSS